MAVPSPSSTPRSPRRPEVIAAPDPSTVVAQPSIDFGDPACLAALRALTDAGAATRLLHECVAYQRALDARLDSLLARRVDIDRAAASLLRSAPPLLSLAASDATALKESSSSTAALADALSSRVRHLDAAHSRADAALARAEAALDRSRVLEAARRALAADDLVAAATAAHEFLTIDARFPTDDNLRRDLLDIKRRLEGLARRRLTAAVDAQDHPAVLRLVRLFPLLALADEGLQVYVAYLKKVVTLRARVDFEHLADLTSATQPISERPDFVGCLTRLFKDIVLAAEENDAVLRELRGEDGVAYAIIELQEECDSRGTQILRRYADYRKLAHLASDINSYTKNLLSVVGSMASAAGGNEGPDPREIELYLEEILALTQLGEDYTEFMVNKIRGLRDVKPELGPQAMKAFRNGSFNKMEQDLTGFYVIFEEFFMVENSCCRRAASTANINSVLTVLGGATSLLSNEYQEALQWRMREPNLGAKLFLGGVGVQKTGEEIATALNNMDISSEYVLKLRHEIEELCAEVFHAPADREKIKSCLSELGDVSASFKKILHSGMEHLVASVAPRIRPVLDTVATVSYELADAEYGENEVNDPWVQKLILGVNTNVAWLQPVMTSNNYDSFVHLIIDFIVKRLEVIMMQKRFSQLGGLQLDKEVRSLINHFSEMSQRPVRDKFSRLSQISTILNFERVSEILDFWGDNAGHLTWLLTPAEVRRVLGLRIDFRPEAIAALRL
ncbi:conserved oligomeric Golgi complex subunit 4-like isoform X2 [Panicum virgatum]|uniref:conserved oligomeric Golgi complex subunit 4-like isoform X2 n=1 Tax=Panicum virgatum TaxID=38727 RepID=UPI0019D51D60|nr:conserved oligomeric Golgi complex subunit 4-like isoform X2 [Panicum virgatum]